MNSSLYWCEKLSEIITPIQARNIYLRHNRRKNRRERTLLSYLKKLFK